jgi:protein-S-isoprenylcysteine O-methyltransferase Ste14
MRKIQRMRERPGKDMHAVGSLMNQRLIDELRLVVYPIALLVLPGLDHRFRWSAVPVWGVVLGDVLVAIGFYLIFLVYRENTFTAASIEVATGQKVIATGPYAVVRYPRHASGSLYVFGTPLALGSYWGFLALAAMMPFLLWRPLDEESIRGSCRDTRNTGSVYVIVSCR